MNVKPTAARIAVLASIGAAGAAIFGFATSGESAQAAVVSAAHAASTKGGAALALTSALASRHYVVAPAGNEARYFAREQLAGVSFPNDAIGVTKGVSGAIVIDDHHRDVVHVGGLALAEREPDHGPHPRRDVLAVLVDQGTDVHAVVPLRS